MAITRAQQYRQMLEDGGMLVKPGNGKRPGYRSAKAQEVQGRTTTSTTKPGTSGGSTAKDDDVAPGYNPKTGRFERPDPSGPPGTMIPEKARTPQEVKQDLRRAVNQGAFRKKGIFDAIFPVATNLVDGFSRSYYARLNNALQRQNYIDSLDLDDPEEKAEYDRVMNELGGLGIDIIAGPETLTDTSLKQPMSLGPPKTTFKTTSSFDDDVSALGDPDVKDILGEGFQDYLNRFDRPDDKGEGPSSDPCKGPNPPAYCFVKEGPTPDPTPARNLGGLAPRFAGSIFDFDEFAADGGRIGAAEGGIMDLETAREAMFLGGIVKGLKKITKKATRAVKKVAKSPIGKAALLGLGAYYMPGFGIKATGGFSNFTQPGGFLSKILTKGGDKALNLDNLSGLKIAGLLTAAPFLFGQQEEEDDSDPNRGPKLTMEELLAIRGAPFNTLAPRFTGSTFAAEGGRMGYQEGSKEPVAKKVMPLLDMGGKEMDLRDNGGFVPIGRMEKADDVPARLSKNEFVFTAEAVRNAGDGDVDKGSEVMYNMMKNLEDGGNVSEESQGLEGARDMFQTAQRLQEII